MAFVTRRDILKLVGGAAVGTLFTPVPWKLLDDIAIWTQNEPWAAPLPRGPRSVAYGHCTACPAGCGVMARCISGRPYGLAGVKGHPTGGALCALGLAAHHLPARAGRLTAPVLRESADAPATVTHARAVALLAGWVAAARRGAGAAAIAVLDGQPGRSGSLLWRRWLQAVGGGTYAVPPSAASAALDAARVLGPAYAAAGPDLARVRTVLSFGAPLADGFGAPRAAARLFAADGPTLLQAEPRLSATAQRATRWLPLRPGSEATLALVLAHLLVRDHRHATDLAARAADLASYGQLVAAMEPARAAAATGLAVEEIEETARRLTAEGPAVVLAGVCAGGGPLPYEAVTAIAALNALVDAGRPGGLVPRTPLPTPEAFADGLAPVRTLAEVADGSLHLLIVDAPGAGTALPPSLLRRKLAPGGRLVALAAFRTGIAREADLVLPAALPLESWDDVPGSPEAAIATYALARPLLTRPKGTIPGPQLVAWLSRAAGVAEPVGPPRERLKERVAAVHALGRGRVLRPAEGDEVALAELDDGDALWEALAAGGCWVDEPAAPAPPAEVRLLAGDPTLADRLRALTQGEPPVAGLTAVPYGWRGTAVGAALPPVLAKLDRESGLRDSAGDAFVSPGTGEALGLSDGGVATLRTEAGAAAVRVRFSAAVMAGVVEVAVGAERAAYGDGGPETGDVLGVVCTAGGCAWRSAPATLAS